MTDVVTILLLDPLDPVEYLKKGVFIPGPIFETSFDFNYHGWGGGGSLSSSEGRAPRPRPPWRLVG